MGDQKIQDFTDLVAWQEAHRLALAVYRFTRKFPRDEMYALSSQMRRAASSVTSNIAEGFGRKTLKDKSHFYTMASASVYELRNHVILASDLEYITSDIKRAAYNSAISVQKLLSALIKSIESKS